MLLELSERICCGAPDRIEQAIAAIDPQATVAVNSVSGSVTIEGVSKEQAIAALASAGFTARSAHVSGGSDCCGGCS